MKKYQGGLKPVSSSNYNKIPESAPPPGWALCGEGKSWKRVSWDERRSAWRVRVRRIHVEGDMFLANYEEAVYVKSQALVIAAEEGRENKGAAPCSVPVRVALHYRPPELCMGAGGPEYRTWVISPSREVRPLTQSEGRFQAYSPEFCGPGKLGHHRWFSSPDHPLSLPHTYVVGFRASLSQRAEENEKRGTVRKPSTPSLRAVRLGMEEKILSLWFPSHEIQKGAIALRVIDPGKTISPDNLLVFRKKNARDRELLQKVDLISGVGEADRPISKTVIRQCTVLGTFVPLRAAHK